MTPSHFPGFSSDYGSDPDDSTGQGNYRAVQFNSPAPKTGQREDQK